MLSCKLCNSVTQSLHKKFRVLLGWKGAYILIYLRGDKMREQSSGGDLGELNQMHWLGPWCSQRQEKEGEWEQRCRVWDILGRVEDASSWLDYLKHIARGEIISQERLGGGQCIKENAQAFEPLLWGVNMRWQENMLGSRRIPVGVRGQIFVVVSD